MVVKRASVVKGHMQKAVDLREAVKAVDLGNQFGITLGFKSDVPAAQQRYVRKAVQEAILAAITIPVLKTTVKADLEAQAVAIETHYGFEIEGD